MLRTLSLAWANCRKRRISERGSAAGIVGRDDEEPSGNGLRAMAASIVRQGSLDDDSECSARRACGGIGLGERVVALLEILPLLVLLLLLLLLPLLLDPSLERTTDA
jgi:hypothetical protein